MNRFGIDRFGDQRLLVVRRDLQTLSAGGFVGSAGNRRKKSDLGTVADLLLVARDLAVQRDCQLGPQSTQSRIASFQLPFEIGDRERRSIQVDRELVGTDGVACRGKG